MSNKNKTQAVAEEAVEVINVQQDTVAVMEPKQETKPEPVAYIGPDMRLVAVNGTIYVNGLPEALKEKINEIPAIKGLIVPVSKLAAASVAVNTTGTALNNLYNIVSAKVQEGEKE